MEIRIAKTDQEIAACFSTMLELRPQISADSFVHTVRQMSDTTGYQLAYLEDQGIKAVAGYRISTWLLTGKYLEIEELVTAAASRSQGYGGVLFDWLVALARQERCQQIRLLSGLARTDAHRFYERKGMAFEAKYFSMMLK